MIPLLRTSRMEEAVLLLDREFEKVMVRAIQHTARSRIGTIRIRPKLLQSINPFICRNAAAFDSEIEHWKTDCGTLLNYRSYMKSEPTLEYDACFLCECPLFMDDIEAYSKGAKKLCVIYQPPNWRAHEEILFCLHPTSKSVKRLVRAVEATKPNKAMLSIALACGIPTAGTYARDDFELREELSVSLDEIKNIRKRALRMPGGRRYSQVIQLIPRIEPDDKVLLDMYRFIKDELPQVGHIKLARDNILSSKARFWRVALRALVRSGSVEKKGTICFYFMDGQEPDYPKIQAGHEAAKAKFARTVEEIERLREFPPRPAKPQPSASRASA